MEEPDSLPEVLRTDGTVVRRSRARQVTLAASFAAVHFVLRAIPTFEMVGICGRFTAGDFMLTSVAIVDGFWSSILAGFVGTAAAYAVRPPSSSVLTFSQA